MKNGAANPELPVRCFLGEFDHTVDAQRRIAIPSAWRDSRPDANRFILLPGRGQALQLVPEELFQELLAKLRHVSFADAKASVALATIGAMAQNCLLDKQARINLTARLMAHAGIQDRAILVGAVTTIQIWEPAAWERQRMDSGHGLDVLQAIQEKPDDFTEILRKAVRPA